MTALTGEIGTIEFGGHSLRFLLAGDRYVLLELAQRMALADNLRAIRLADLLQEQNEPGIVETLPMFVSVLIHYDSTELSPQRLFDLVRSLWSGIAAEEDIVIPSRLIEIPVHYLDPWTRDCVADYRRSIGEIEDNPAFVARINGLSDPDELVLRHSSTQHWVGGVGFTPGLPDLMPLDPRSALSVPKYNPPRLWTPVGAIGVGGGFTSIYTMRSPGGYYLIGRTPVSIYSLDTRLAPFRRRATLLAPADRVKFRTISHDEFVEIEAEIAASVYQYLVWDYELFSLSRYHSWLAEIEDAKLPAVGAA
jgi:KipI family sensor histidine kinase inhibitor